MVNETAPTPSYPAGTDLDERDRLILQRLRTSPGPVSGERLAQELGLSRVALFKRVEGLRARAYQVLSDRHGYRLLGEDAVVPAEFAPGQPVHWFPQLPSTMDEAWRLGMAGAPAGSLVIADRQSAGRGQAERSWLSPAGGLYLSVLLRPPVPAGHLGGLVLAAGRIMLEIIEQRFGLSLDLHWPNDLMVGSAKLGGLLLEWAGEPGRPRFVSLGLGLNLHAVDLGERPTAGLAELAHSPLRRRELAAPFRQALLAWSAEPQFGWQDIERRYPLNGKQLRVQDWAGREYCGRSLGFSQRGGLRLETTNGVEEFLNGETKLVRPMA